MMELWFYALDRTVALEMWLHRLFLLDMTPVLLRSVNAQHCVSSQELLNTGSYEMAKGARVCTKDKENE